MHSETTGSRMVYMKSIQSRLRKKHPPAPSLQQRHYEATRGTTAERGYDHAWQALRAKHLAVYPACKRCGKVDASNHVDHIMAHRGDDTFRLDPANLQTLCHSHHSRKTRRHDGGFGNEAKHERERK